MNSFSTVGGTYTVEWAAGHIVLGSAVADSMGSSNVGRIYDVSDATGTTYFYGLRPNAGNTSVYSLRAHKASAGNFGSAASPAASAINIPAGTAGFISYATGADPTAFNAVTVVNENAGSGSYTLYRDTQAPSGTIAINNGAAGTNNVNVTLNLTATNPTSGDPVSTCGSRSTA